MARRDKMKLDQAGVRSTCGCYGVYVPLKKANVDAYFVQLQQDSDMSDREYGQLCSYVRRALKEYRETGGK